MKEININNLKEYLKQRSKEDLIGEISDLFTKFEFVRDAYKVKLGNGDSLVLGKYKDIIKTQFFPKRGSGKLRLSVAKKAISDYRKMSDSKEGLADIMLFYVELGVRFTNSYGDINGAFYTSIENMYEKAIKYITIHNMQDMFRARCKKVVEDTRGIGWGFHDTLAVLYGEHFDE